MYAEGEYVLAGFAVGVVEKSAILDGKLAQPGDVCIGVASSGLHSNGYSLARRVIESAGLGMSDPMPGDPSGRTVGQVLLTPTRIYAKAARAVIDALGASLRSLCHVTGGGLPENLPRVLPEGVGARLDLSTFERPNVFRLVQERGPVEEPELRRTFNCGVGLVAIVTADAAERAVRALEDAGERAWVLGALVPGEGVAFAGD